VTIICLPRRDCRLVVTERTTDAWLRTAAATALLDIFELEAESLSTAIVADAEALQKRLEYDDISRLNSPFAFCCCGGQLEAWRGQVIPNYEDAVLLDRRTVQAVNAVIVEAAGKVLESMQTCVAARQQIHRNKWEIQQRELSAGHKQAHTRELQLLHVTRNIQKVLDSNGKRTRDTLAEQARLEQVKVVNERIHVRPVYLLSQIQGSIYYSRSAATYHSIEFSTEMHYKVGCVA
jgi:hypothetical protein